MSGLSCPLVLVLLAVSAAGAAQAGAVACRFDAFCHEGSMCGATDRAARIEPAEPEGWALRLDTGTVSGALRDFGAGRLFEGTAEGLRLLLGIDADGTARMMAMEAAPLRVVVYLGSCEDR